MSYVRVDGRLSDFDFLVSGHKNLHDYPCQEIGDSADAEYDEVSGGLACERHEREIGLCGVVEENARAKVDKERSDTTCHTADTDDGGDGALGEHITCDRVDVGRP